MKAKEFDEVNVRLAEHQEEYQTLPVHYNPTEGSMSFCFELSEEERKQVNETGEIWVKVLTFGNAMQPILVTVDKKEVIGRKS